MFENMIKLYNFINHIILLNYFQNILLSDSSSDEDEEKPITNEDLQTMLKIHKYQRKHQMMFYQDNEVMSTVRIYTKVLSGTNSGISLMTEGH